VGREGGGLPSVHIHVSQLVQRHEAHLIAFFTSSELRGEERERKKERERERDAIPTIHAEGNWEEKRRGRGTIMLSRRVRYAGD